MPGPIAASTPATAARATYRAICGPGIEIARDALVLERLGQAEPDPDAEPGAGHRPDEGDHHRLPADHRSDLAARHADRAEQTQLSGALEDRQRQGVDDAEERDDDREQQHHRDEGQQAVDEPARVRLELVLVQDLRVRVVGQGRRDRVLDLVPVGARRQLHQRRGDELRPGEGVLLVDARSRSRP